jgi:hypothetical protein
MTTAAGYTTGAAVHADLLEADVAAALARTASSAHLSHSPERSSSP